MMKAIDCVTLASVTGGAGTQNDNDVALAGCKEWAEKAGSGRDYKLGLCDQQYVKSNWKNFSPTPGYSPRRPL